MKEIWYDKDSLMNGEYPVIKKLGIINNGCETSPFVFKDKLQENRGILLKYTKVKTLLTGTKECCSQIRDGLTVIQD